MIRIACCVPHCREMIRAEQIQEGAPGWLCREHFAAVPAIRRRAYRKACERLRDRRAAAAVRLWRRIRAQAIEAAQLGERSHAA
ncbi:hypothetical protein [Methylobacterium oryzisoli]|uniref:hypothetical protein n=1 Tax=Methylobacterium oryzisoli TaxID=3385502 RepID=UPI0038911CB3